MIPGVYQTTAYLAEFPKPYQAESTAERAKFNKLFELIRRVEGAQHQLWDELDLATQGLLEEAQEAGVEGADSFLTVSNRAVEHVLEAQQAAFRLSHVVAGLLSQAGRREERFNTGSLRAVDFDRDLLREELAIFGHLRKYLNEREASAHKLAHRRHADSRFDLFDAEPAGLPRESIERVYESQPFEFASGDEDDELYPV